ncbi:GGDEF domain-containing response regulator [Nitrospira moscoviensis]|uniref:Response regulator receiver modulated diguanylate cyclase/phosphodiesterase n=1 Tax=Nitrospira moscoviensis TaxID=42253 RepID=A0A0K2GHK4_NITMO|nr:GGDEF domain-containing response regulator [Nitrospira moscoviensis]ALA60112.1 Response regulator receiver modulated diguanylate cyclase/phosphodiesterase [Nitrospira moscoviensis]
MPTKLNLLLLEDSPPDAELMIETLREAGFDPHYRRVDTKAAYLQELEQPPDFILSDYSMPQFTAREALQLLRERGLDLPFIIVSGCIGEDMAVECMKAGAADYLLKDRLARLGHAVSQALERKRLVEEKRQAEQRLFLETFHDSLTGLPNRALFLDRLERVFLQSRRQTAHSFAVLYMNLDGFRVIHDSLGPSAADRLLIEVSQRLLRRVRSADTVARIEGDEFAFLLDDLKAPANATRVAERLQREFSTPFTLEGRQVFLTVSMGIASSHTGYQSSEAVLRDAMTAMHQAKALGRAGFVIFDKAMHEHAMARLRLEADLRQAVARNEFQLDYQPIVALESGAVAGFEALLRWRHPEYGVMGPGGFLAMAAELGLVNVIGEWIFREACRRLNIWHGKFPYLRPLTMSINCSVHQFAQPDLALFIKTVLSDTGTDPASLKIEITESDMMHNPDAVTEVLKLLRAEQIEACLDDFGTGYSSLSHLQQLPIKFLKIDQSFVKRLGVDDDALAIVKTIVMLAHQLGREVIAEGVETAEHRSILRSLGCEYGQGYFFAKPLSEDEAFALLSSGRRW